MMRHYLILYLLFIAFLSCKKEHRAINIAEPKAEAATIDADTLQAEADPAYYNLKLSLGIVMSNERFTYGDTIKIYSTENKLMHEMIMDDDKIMLAEPCLFKDSLVYTILYNNSKVIVKKSDKIDFQTWEEHIIKNVASISFSTKTNPLRQEPDEKSTEISYNNDELFDPVKIKGDWLQIRWGNSNYGWIKWKENDMLIIELSYLC